MPYHVEHARAVTVYDPARAFNGYTLFAPTFGTDCWLIDMWGRIVHHWELATPPASHGKLLSNGNLMWQGKGPGSMSDFVGSGTELVEVDWDGREVWRYEEAGINHDFLPLENGNVIINVYALLPEDLRPKIKGGIHGTERQDRMWTSALKEITREGEVVWEWNLAEHLDLETDVLCPLCPRRAWGFINSLALLPEGNVMFVMRLLNDFGVVDRQTGDIIWRYGRDKKLGHPHGCSALENGHYMIFDNGLHRYSDDVHIADIAASRVLEIDPGTKDVVWQYMDPFAPNFFSAICAGAQRLPNGNTLICEATKGKLFELTHDKDVVWEYHSPFRVPRPDYWGWTVSATIWQAHRYPPTHPGLAGKDLDPARYEGLLRQSTK